jgi:lipid II:glycine glycyltransferase (peptidoglycan interpeptide bridge formation enzyme)
MPILSDTQWESFMVLNPHAHILQSWGWGELKVSFGWEVVRVLVETADGPAGAQILFRKLPLGFSLAYLPKGPVLHDKPPGEKARAWSSLGGLWEEIDGVCRQKKAVLLKVEPDLLDTEAMEPPRGFRASPHAIQPLRTILVDLAGSEADIQGRMKQKTRYNIRLAQKKGVKVSASTEVDRFYQILRATGERNQFAIHTPAYYRRALELFSADQSCQLLLAEFEGEILAGLMVFAHGQRSWYFYGASAERRREVMPAYLLQWEAMRWARSRSCLQYDLWGVPDADEATLESQFEKRSDGLWGVYRFKRGFGGKLVRSAGPWDRVYHSGLYLVYLVWAKRGGLRG